MIFLVFLSQISQAASGEGIPFGFITIQTYNVVLFSALMFFLLRGKVKTFFQERNSSFLDKVGRVQALKKEAEDRKNESQAETKEICSRMEDNTKIAISLAQKTATAALSQELFYKAFREASRNIPKELNEKKKQELYMEFLEGLKS